MKSRVRFVGREKELSYLNQLINRGSASFVVLRGRRRIGKSRLIDEFAREKKMLKFTGLPPQPGVGADQQREHFAQQLQAQLGGIKPASDSWFNLLMHLANELDKKQLIIALDEISWMAQDDPLFLPVLKDMWDNYFSKKHNLTFIVCGSISSWIEENILSSTGFFGRVCERITLDELKIDECVQLMQAAGFNGSSLEKICLLSISGGVPWYIELLARAKNLNEAIMHHCFREDGLLFDEYHRIFNDLFGRRSKTYAKIIDCLASGPKQQIDILNELGLEKGGVISQYLNDLSLSGFIAKDTVWSFKSGKSRSIARYRLKDNYLRFYLRVIMPNENQIRSNYFQNQAYTEIKAFNTVLGLQFENIVLNNRELIFKALGLQLQELVGDNPYYQRATKRIKGCQIDYLIQTKLNHLYACEIKLKQKVLGASVIEEMKTRLANLSKPNGFAISPVLIHFGELSESLEAADYFSTIIDFSQFL